MVETVSKEGQTPRDGMLAAFEEFERRSQGKTPSWLQALHKGGIAHFAELGFPTTKHEEWRFTNVAPIARSAWTLAPRDAARVTAADVARISFPGIAGKRLVFIDGVFAPDLSVKLPTGTGPGLRIQNLQAALRATTLPQITQHLARYARYDENAFVALNTAFLDDGALIVAPPQQAAEEPIYILHISSGAVANSVSHPRVLIQAQRGSSAKVIEHFVSLRDTPSFTNAVTEIVVEEGARVEHCKIQEESLRSFHIATIQTQQARGSWLLSHSISMGAALARNNVNCALDGEGIEATLNGLYLGREQQLVDHHTAIFHNKPNCNSHEFYHGILDGRSHGVFNGKIFVRPEAQKTDAKQTNRNLLLSDEAAIDTKPQLEIFADDVRCTHGATIGQLDQESIFYLRARGIGLETARKMLLHAFASEIVNRITIPGLSERLDSQLFDMYER
jgi:Fe-S cluster assembly protein SufD